MLVSQKTTDLKSASDLIETILGDYQKDRVVKSLLIHSLKAEERTKMEIEFFFLCEENVFKANSSLI